MTGGNFGLRSQKSGERTSVHYSEAAKSEPDDNLVRPRAIWRCLVKIVWLDPERVLIARAKDHPNRVDHRRLACIILANERCEARIERKHKNPVARTERPKIFSTYFSGHLRVQVWRRRQAERC